MPKKIQVRDMEHLCNKCKREFATCEGDKIVFGCNIDESAVGADADKVIQCDWFLGDPPLGGEEIKA